MAEQLTRYPGTQSFESTQRDIFFGRDIDIEKLTQMIELERMVLVYAKSGIGKTSLINAGVLPGLQEKGSYTFHKIRFGAWQENKPSPCEIASGSFSHLHNSPNFIDKIIYKDRGLWYHSKLWQIGQQEMNKPEEETLLLIFDQFEELFSYPEDQVTEFKQELAELLFTVVPQRFTDQKELMSEIKPGFISADEEAILFAQPKVKILFAIRNDRMSQLNRMSDYIPRILLKHYELLPLTNEQAFDAICKPAQLEGGFSSPQFIYSNEALTEIMNFLTKEGTQNDNIESFQLQILCKVVEGKVKNLNIKEILPAHIVPVKDIYQNYYDNLIEDLPVDKGKKLLVRIMIEDGLIEEATKRRLQLAGEQIEFKFHIESDLLNELINERLLRVEERDNFKLYELSHDTLVAPIIESARIRKEREEEERAQAAHNEQIRIANEKAEKERIEREKERKRQRTIIYIISVAAIISIGFAIFGFVMWQKSKDTLQRLIIKDAYNFYQNEAFLAARDKYKELLRFSDTTEAVRKRMRECEHLDTVKEIFNLKIASVDSLTKTEDLNDLKTAKSEFEEIEKLDYKQGKNRLRNLQYTYTIRVNNLISNRLKTAENMTSIDLREDLIEMLKDLEELSPGNKKIEDFKRRNKIEY